VQKRSKHFGGQVNRPGSEAKNALTARTQPGVWRLLYAVLRTLLAAITARTSWRCQTSRVRESSRRKRSVSGAGPGAGASGTTRTSGARSTA